MTDMREHNRALIAEYRQSEGALSGPMAGAPIVLLTTSGRRSGRPHTTPLGFVEDRGRLVVAAANGGAVGDPDWYRNVVASPTVSVELGSRAWRAVAEVVDGAERDRLFGRLADTLPGMTDYAAAAGRTIPVVVLAEAGGLAAAAERLRSLHRPGEPLVLVNAWDAASAQHVEVAGGSAIGTSSAAIAASLGVADDRTTPVPAMFDAVRRIVGAVTVPVTADLLDGYGLDAPELVDRLLGVGAVGCNIEDSDHVEPGRLLDPSVAAERIAAVRTAASRAGVAVVINARVDSYLYDAATDAATPWADIGRRARAYLDAGADCVYPVRLTDPRLVAELVADVGAPVNANLAPGSTVADLAAAGASRVSVGPMAHRVALAALDDLAADLLGTRE